MKYDLFEIKTFWFLKNSKGEYLFMHNTHEDSIIKGFVNPPAGHMDAGETLVETVTREVEEETGITQLSNVSLKGIVNVVGFKDNPVLLLVIAADIPDDQKPVQKDEGEPIWISLDQLDQHKVFDDVLKIAELVEKTPKDKIFHAKSGFEGKKLVSFEVN